MNREVQGGFRRGRCTEDILFMLETREDNSDGEGEEECNVCG